MTQQFRQPREILLYCDSVLIASEGGYKGQLGFLSMTIYILELIIVCFLVIQIVVYNTTYKPAAASNTTTAHITGFAVILAHYIVLLIIY